MTYYSFTVTLGDEEFQTVREALSHYVAHCERKLAKGSDAPFWLHKRIIARINSKLDDALVRGVRAHERWLRSVEREKELDRASMRKGRARIAHSRAQRARKRRRSKPKHS
jgi:hypothetical protein